MKKLNIRLKSLLTGTLSGILVLLGFSGCKTQKSATSGEDAPGQLIVQPPMRVMYGVPANMYKDLGTTQTEDETPGDEGTSTPSEREK